MLGSEPGACCDIFFPPPNISELGIVLTSASQVKDTEVG